MFATGFVRSRYRNDFHYYRSLRWKKIFVIQSIQIKGRCFLKQKMKTEKLPIMIAHLNLCRIWGIKEEWGGSKELFTFKHVSPSDYSPPKFVAYFRQKTKTETRFLIILDTNVQGKWSYCQHSELVSSASSIAFVFVIILDR